MNLLLAEDDTVSREFLGEVLRGAGHHVRTVSDGSAALNLANMQPFDLLLLDLNLPGLCGDKVLAALRDNARPSHSTNRHTPAIVLTADLDAAQRARLIAAGFIDAIGKPVSADNLIALVAARQSCSDSRLNTFNNAADSQPLWDDAAALTIAGGNQRSLVALRGLFRNELPMQRQRMLSAIEAADAATLAAELHRLRASCGFCGAAKLGEVARALSAEVASAQLVNAASSKALITVLDATLHSLDEGISVSIASP